MKTSKSELLLRELRKLNQEMNPADPSPIQTRRFRDLFNELDALLKSGATFPTSWITRTNYTQLPIETTHTITDFDPPRKQGLAWCGHPFASTTEYCRNPSCGNYVHNHSANF